ncbi:hypothetical protein GCM10027290_19200 [Micromonospora sonneratiae]
MRTRGGWLRRATVMVAVTLVMAATGASPAGAIDGSKGRPGYCPDGTGVTVVVDFQDLGGATIVRCAPGDQSTGLTALKNAGFQIAGVARWGESFICRIEGRPGPASEKCIDTPPATAYWSYWHAPNGGAWKYSEWGVTNRKPPQGSFEGWSFSKNRTETTNPPPRVAPSRPKPPAPPKPPSTTPARPGGTPPGSAPAAGGAPAAPRTPAGTAAPATTASSAAATDTPSGTPVVATSPAEPLAWTGGEELVREGRSGIPASTLFGIGLLAVLGIAAGVTVRRRRTRPSGPDD